MSCFDSSPDVTTPFPTPCGASNDPGVAACVWPRLCHFVSSSERLLMVYLSWVLQPGSSATRRDGVSGVGARAVISCHGGVGGSDRSRLSCSCTGHSHGESPAEVARTAGDLSSVISSTRSRSPFCAQKSPPHVRCGTGGAERSTRRRISATHHHEIPEKRQKSRPQRRRSVR